MLSSFGFSDVLDGKWRLASLLEYHLISREGIPLVSTGKRWLSDP